MRKPVVGVLGGGDDASDVAVAWATELGGLIARNDWLLLNGGRNAGVMNAVSTAARDAGGFVLGVLIGKDTEGASDGLSAAIVTGMGSARNNIIVLTCDALIACGEVSAGTLSEIALAVKAKKHVVVLNTDDLTRTFLGRMGGGFVQFASTPAEAIAAVKERLTA